MNIRRFPANPTGLAEVRVRLTPSAPRNDSVVLLRRLQLLLAHERLPAGSDLVSILREEILAVIAKHVQLDHDKVQIKIDRDENVSILEIDVEIPLDVMKAA